MNDILMPIILFVVAIIAFFDLKDFFVSKKKSPPPPPKDKPEAKPEKDIYVHPEDFEIEEIIEEASADSGNPFSDILSKYGNKPGNGPGDKGSGK